LTVFRDQRVDVHEMRDAVSRVLGDAGDDHSGVAVPNENGTWRSSRSSSATTSRMCVSSATVSVSSLRQFSRPCKRCDDDLSAGAFQSGREPDPMWRQFALRRGSTRPVSRPAWLSSGAASCAVMRSRTEVIWKGNSRLLVVVSIASPAAHCSIKPANDFWKRIGRRVHLRFEGLTRGRFRSRSLPRPPLRTCVRPRAG
jgi:hypothetical protein